jgi:hypothetical protein
MPVEGPNGTTCMACPAGTTLVIGSEGYNCVPVTNPE